MVILSSHRMSSHIGYTFIGQSSPPWESQDWVWGMISFILTCLVLSLFLLQMVIFECLLYWLETPSVHSPTPIPSRLLSLCKEFSRHLECLTHGRING